MNRTINEFIVLLSVVALFIFACDNNNNSIASDSSDKVSDVAANVVQVPKNIQYYDFEQTIDNCAPGKTTHTFTTSSITTKSLNISDTTSGGGSIGIEIPMLIKAGLEGEITRGYQNIFEQAKKEEYQVAKEIPPWHVMKIKVRFKKKIYESEITYKKDKKRKYLTQ